MNIAEAAKSAFFEHRDHNTGWGVPNRVDFTVDERWTMVEMRWKHLASGFGKRPVVMEEVQCVPRGDDGKVMQDIVEHHARSLAHNCINSYILWCGQKDDAQIPVHA